MHPDERERVRVLYSNYGSTDMELETTHWNVIGKSTQWSFVLHEPVTTDRLVPRTAYARVFKRVLDVIVSSVLIVLLLSWLIPLLFVLIRLSSKGSLFFIQQRTGRGGRPFPCIKFRTMRI